MLPDPGDVLRRVFGFECFRGVQEAVIRDVVAGRDVALVMPTGAGKSLCYQVPALVRPGAAIVISPLIALMDDQVEALLALGVRAAALHSGRGDGAETLARLRGGDLDLLYVAPERAVSAGFADVAAGARVALLAIDEAHCVSQWGHDFRPDYRRLRPLADRLGGVPRIALTATADAATRADICTELGIAPDRLVVAGFDRPNIHYAARPRKDGPTELRRFLDAHAGEAGIVYCATRARAEETAAFVARTGRSARAYHAGLAPAERQANQQWFRRTEDGVMAATIAFGMGIDKPDVRFVVHMGLPKSIEAYYQETGRAGRDGLPAHALMLWGAEDMVRARQWIAESDASPARKAHETAQLEALARYAEALGCRRAPLLTHFGEPAPPPCGRCDNCDAPPAARDMSVAARKLLSAAHRTGQNFGLAHLVAVLRGDADDRTRRLGHDRLSVFGIGQDLSAAQWQRLGKHLEATGALARDPEHGGLRLTAAARPILKGEAQVALRADLVERARKARPARAAAEALPPDAARRFEALKTWRRATAESEGVPAYVVFPDATLVAIATVVPSRLDMLSRLPGVGAVKLQRYGQQLLQVLAAAS